MDSFDWNRLGASVVLSGCVLAGAWFIGNSLIQHTPPLKPAFFIESDEDKAINLASANIEKGKESALQQCAICHNFEKGAANKIGPTLYGVVGRKITSLQWFNYSDSLRKHQKDTWGSQNLNEWLKSPMMFASGTTMSYPGVASEQDRINIIGYLNTLSTAPQQAEKKTTLKPQISRATQALATGKQAYDDHCAVCHSVDPKGTKGLGPNLYNIIDKPIASQMNYNYSKALQSKQGHWTKDNLDQWIENPGKWVPGNKMIYDNITSSEVRKNIILYLHSLSKK